MMTQPEKKNVLLNIKHASQNWRTHLGEYEAIWLEKSQSALDRPSFELIVIAENAKRVKDLHHFHELEVFGVG